ncbi:MULTISPECIES: protein LphB [Legionella]|uniref:Protein LphB n=1 Tax=Legionella resiliens TaxID=2905958 RepID=A0ABS8X8U1_9GAMM|nr:MULTISPECIES: protein LphB [unclassified Legionella]MCE0724440.1 protein LphB [Legionella sp. 9fVS26]MCE3533592.1 protein LphB [Legionella sp. 8cVS16]QLZ69782.1 hypothetical protein FOLKNPGA_02581 [Legionella sp. PC1000]
MSKKLYILLILCVGAYFLLLQSHAAWSFIIDDVYIPLRYAKHWISGSGLLWNRGEAPVEGYSSFSFLLLSAAGMALNLNPILLLKVAGFLGLAFTTCAVYCLSRLLCSMWFALIPCFWLLMYRGQIFWAVSGMETAVYQAFICFALFFLLRGIGYTLFPAIRTQSKPLFLVFSGLFFAFAALTRPEAPILALLFYMLALWDRPSFFKTYYWHLFLSGLVFAGIFVPYFFWRWHYFGRLLPNPIYCKGFSNEFIYKLDWSYLRFAWPFLLLAAAASYKSKDKLLYFFWLPSLIYLLLLLNADPLSAYFNRLFLPAFALILPLALQGLMRFLDKYLPERNEVYAFTLYIIAGNIAFFFIPAMSLKAYRTFTINPQQGEVLRERVADWLDRYIPQGSWVALGDVGLIGYRSNLNFLDSYCLNNKAMSFHPDMYQWQCDEVMKIKPEVIILQSTIDKKGQLYYPATDACLREKLKTNSKYHYNISLTFCSFTIDCHSYTIFLRNSK